MTANKETTKRKHTDRTGIVPRSKVVYKKLVDALDPGEEFGVGVVMRVLGCEELRGQEIWDTTVSQRMKVLTTDDKKNEFPLVQKISEGLWRMTVKDSSNELSSATTNEPTTNGSLPIVVGKGQRDGQWALQFPSGRFAIAEEV